MSITHNEAMNNVVNSDRRYMSLKEYNDLITRVNQTETPVIHAANNHEQQNKIVRCVKNAFERTIRFFEKKNYPNIAEFLRKYYRLQTECKPLIAIQAIILAVDIGAGIYYLCSRLR